VPNLSEPANEPTSIDSPHPRSSRRWFFIAIAVTLVFVAVVAYEFSNLLALPRLSSETSEKSGVSSEGNLIVAVARTPGGPGEWSNWARIIRVLSDELDVPFTVRYLSKEDEAARIIAEDKVDIAFVCAHHYVDLVDDDACEGIATPVIDGSTTSRSLLVVRTDDPARGIEDLAGSLVAVSDKSSLGGYAFLSYLLQQRGTQAEDYFSELRLGETQEQNLHDVLAGDARATVINSAQTASLDLSGVRVIEESEPFGCPPVVVRADLDPELRDRIQQALLGMDMGVILPEDSAIDGFERLDPAEYEFARELRGACAHHAED